MRKHRRLLWSFGLIAVMSLVAGEARAASIMMTLSYTGAATSLTIPNSSLTPDTNFQVSNATLTAINGYLANTGYNFQSLSGSSNNPGVPNPNGQAVLTVTGEADATGNTSGITLTLTETEGGFSAPTGNPANLNSSSSATFTNQPTGITNNSVTSDYNGTTTAGPYTLNSSWPGPPNTMLNPNSQSGSANAAIPGGIPTGPLYSLGNTVNITLSSPLSSSFNPVKDQFTTSALVTATTVPEPASITMFLASMPLPLALVGLLYLRRRRAVAQV
jgi:hypothetical protein